MISITSLLKFYEFVQDINQNSSRNYKLERLKYYGQFSDITFYLNFIYNPYIVTGISSKKLYKKLSQEAINDGEDFDTVPDFLIWLETNNTGKDSAIATAQKIKRQILATTIADRNFYSLPEVCDLFDAIVTKNLSLGIDVKTINKAVPKLIPTFSVQLANKYFDNPKIVEGKEFALTTKIDGGRIIAIKNNGAVKMFTRAGQLYEGLVDLEAELQEKFPDNLCLDGEITLLDPENLPSGDQYKQTMKITRADGEKHGVKMIVFDIMTADQFNNKKCDLSYRERRKQLNELFEKIKPTYFYCLPVLYSGSDTSKILEILKAQLANQQEGIMINLLEAPYQFKRTNDLLKVKKFTSCDLQVVGVEEGTGKNEGKLGAFLCEYKDGNIVKVGSGISDELRTLVWADPNKYINTIIEVKYFEETENADGGVSLRFPTFKDFRFDKIEPNWN